MSNVAPLLIGWLLDLVFGDPSKLPHPIVWFGKAIAFCEHRLNRGNHRKLKGALTAVFLIVATFKTERYKDFGCWAAHIDDIANYIPARLTAFLMILPKLLTFHFSLFTFVRKYGRCHASPNSGYPEAALAGILDCRFGGPHYYFGELFDKPFIGTNDRPLTTADMKTAVRINRTAEILMVLLTATVCLFRIYIY